MVLPGSDISAVGVLIPVITRHAVAAAVAAAHPTTGRTIGSQRGSTTARHRPVPGHGEHRSTGRPDDHHHRVPSQQTVATAVTGPGSAVYHQFGVPTRRHHHCRDGQPPAGGQPPEPPDHPHGPAGCLQRRVAGPRPRPAARRWPTRSPRSAGTAHRAPQSATRTASR